MKINKRLLWANITITLITMLLLGMVIRGIVSNHFEKETRKDMVQFGEVIENWLTFRELYLGDHEHLIINDEILRRIGFRYNPLNFALLIESDDQVYTYTSPRETVNVFGDYPEDEIIRTQIEGVEYLVLSQKQTFDFEEHSFSVEIIIYGMNNQRQEAVSQVMFTILGAILIIGFIMFVLTYYYDSKLLEPVNKLVAATKLIGQKKYGEVVPVKTGDEFEILSDALLDMSGRLKDLDQEQRHFYENISHEVKTPLAVISGYAQSLKHNLVEDQEQTLDIIIKQCNQMKGLMEDSIFLSKLDASDSPYIMVREDITETIGELLNDYEHLLLSKGIDIIYEPDHSLYVYHDVARIQRAIGNIMTNCMRYAMESIQVTIKQSTEVHITIRDDGPGFNPMVLKEPYSRLNRAYIDGNGIGLSIIKKVLEDHGGHLTLYNQDGAVYHMTLPIG